MPGSAAAAYGCQTFGPRRGPAADPPDIAPRSARAGVRDDVAGPIAADTTWDAATVRVVGDVVVLAGATLTISAGVRVEFAGYHALRVAGRLLAVGTPTAPIVFTSGEPAAVWNGLRFESTPAASGASQFTWCVFENAKATWQDMFVGPLVLVGVRDLRVADCIFRRNVADHGAAVFCVASSPDLVNCLITGNDALAAGAAVFAVDAYPRLLGCTVAGNRDRNPEIFDEAAAVMSYFGKPRLTGCILWGNETQFFEPAQSWQIKAYSLSWSDVKGGHAGVGNLDADPRFADGGLPFALGPSSPCIDTGPPDAAGWPAVDLAGRPRIQAGRVDMGAYEFTAATATPPAAPAFARLAPACPNPANPRTTLAFTLPAAGCASLRIHDLRGRLVRTLHDGCGAAGTTTATWDGKDDDGHDAASGAYVARLDAGGRTLSRTVVLVR